MLLHCMSIILRPNCDVTVALLSYFDGLQHEGAMSTKPVFEKITKVVCPVCFCSLLTPARTVQ